MEPLLLGNSLFLFFLFFLLYVLISIFYLFSRLISSELYL
ncbi:hypothetical protein ACJIZ3_012705 [Penstemon smallii]|uniref:ATP synthase F0 subunit 8 n=1 Tax=Penstemon smallii TaxID=265156 RepID=A0ABD3UQP1_9LAMI